MKVQDVLSKIKSYFEPAKPWTPERVWNSSSCMYFFNWKQRRVVGWLFTKPKVGDEFRSKMESGKVARFKIIKVDRCGDPQDMFFCNVEDVGYVDGL